jgi:hypothetical protein
VQKRVQFYKRKFRSWGLGAGVRIAPDFLYAEMTLGPFIFCLNIELGK